MKTILKHSIFLMLLFFSNSIWSQPGTICWREISAGKNFSLAIKNDGTLWGWGLNSNQLGLGFTGNQNAHIQIGTANDWMTVSAGANHSLAVKTNGTLWAWGDGQFGQLGNGVFNSATWNVTQVGTATNWSSVSAGTIFSIALKSNGTLWSWGRNNTGQLGNNTVVDLNVPTQVGAATDWMLIDAGDQHSLAIKTNNAMYAWGNNASGQLGDGSNTTSLIPIPITTTLNWITISAGGGHSMAIDVNNVLWTWGNNVDGQLGDGSNTASPVPVNISFNSAGTVSPYIKISAGLSHSIAILNDNTLWTCGLNLSGQLGLGNNSSVNSMNMVGLQNTWDKISAGNLHSLALEFSSALWSTGRNMEGQLGLATNTASNNLMLINCPPPSSLSVDELTVNRLKFEVFPNPSSGNVNIKFDSEISGNATITLMDIQGKKLMRSTETIDYGETIKTLDLSFQTAGVYFIVLEINGIKETMRISKN